LLAEEAHSDIVPQLGRVGGLDGSHSVLDERNIHIRVVLQSSSQPDVTALRILAHSRSRL